MRSVEPEILLIYHHPLEASASTIMQHVDAFVNYSRFNIIKINTALGFPEIVENKKFKSIILHYSLFGTYPFSLYNSFREFVAKSESRKIAFFQDEHQLCDKRFNLINSIGIDTIFTLLDPPFFKDTYFKYSNAKNIFYTLPGYVSDELITLAEKLYKPLDQRRIDIGYRGRKLAYYMGKGAQEKYLIAKIFKEKSVMLNLKIDVETDENKRIYGDKWFEFIADCRAFLGVEAGTSIFDLENKVIPAYEIIMKENPDISFEEISKKLLEPYEDIVYYRELSPRHFEAAALKVCQILFEGNYSGIMEPMKHYIPLKKDFSNFNDVIEMFKDIKLRDELTENAYRDLILSRKYSYCKFIEDFDTKISRIINH